MVSGNKAQLIERILHHAGGSLDTTFDEDIEEVDEDESMSSSTNDDTSSDSEAELSEDEGSLGGGQYVEQTFQVLFVDEEDIPQVK